MIAVTARTIPKTYASLAGSSFGAMVSPPGVRGAMPDLEGRNRERCVSYVTLRRLSKKCKVAKRPHQLAIIWVRCLQAQHSKAVARPSGGDARGVAGAVHADASQQW